MVKKAYPDMAVGAGMITTAEQVNNVVTTRKGQVDVALLGREFLRNPYFVLRTASELGVAMRPAVI